MPVGRKPKPTALKVVTGNPGKRPLNNNEPQIPTFTIPNPPAHLNEIALDEWNNVAPSLFNCGILSVVDRAALGAYCQAYARWAEAEALLAEMKLTVETAAGNHIQNPLVGIANKAAGDMMKYAAEFGMTPSARSRLSLKEKQPDARPESKYLA